VTAERDCVIVSPYFPPSVLAGAHRARLLTKHLPAVGWRPTVICVDEAYHEEALDPDFANFAQLDAEIIKVGALPIKLTRPFGLGEISARAWRPLRAALFARLKRSPVGTVLITGSPYYPMLLASEIRKRFGVPVVLDFQDPWVSAWGATQPFLSKQGLSHALARVLEPRALRHADFVTSVSAIQNAELAQRHPWFDASRMAAIPIGGDREDFRSLVMSGGAPAPLDPMHVTLSYVGTIWPAVNDSLKLLLRAVAHLKTARPKIYASLRLNFVGTTADPNGRGGYRVMPLAEQEGVADIIIETPERIGYLKALAITRRSEGILMLGSDEPHYTASKIYGVLMSGRPYLSLFHQDSSSHAILTAAGGGLAIGFTPEGRWSLIEAIADGLTRFVEHPDSFDKADPLSYTDYEASAIAARFGNVFDHLLLAKQQAVS
jgi:hypothetical protein